MQSNLSIKPNINASFEQSSPNGLHVAIIMDGNGRWGVRQGQSRLYGHKIGVEAVRRVVRAAPEEGIGMLTLYGFSSDNMDRPKEEVEHFFALLRQFVQIETPNFKRADIRFVVIGRRDRLPGDLCSIIEESERQTREGNRLIVRVALDYSARQQILSTMRMVAENDAQSISRALSGVGLDWPVDLLIRTSGEQRLSDFLLWESAYAELYFTSRAWPDFTRDDLCKALEAFRQRQRRFGKVPSLDGPTQQAV